VVMFCLSSQRRCEANAGELRPSPAFCRTARPARAARTPVSGRARTGAGRMRRARRRYRIAAVRVDMARSARRFETRHLARPAGSSCRADRSPDVVRHSSGQNNAAPALSCILHTEARRRIPADHRAECDQRTRPITTRPARRAQLQQALSGNRYRIRSSMRVLPRVFGFTRSRSRNSATPSS
jgi:hypothetical protein